jgi:hypothetical protein
LRIADCQTCLSIINPQSEIINPERSPAARGETKVYGDAISMDQATHNESASFI